MKKLTLAIIAVTALGIASCKKDETVTPLKVRAPVVADQKDSGSWD